jgi:hypothetical protein
MEKEAKNEIRKPKKPGAGTFLGANLPFQIL